MINLGRWNSPHSCHRCTLVAEALVIIPVVTAMGGPGWSVVEQGATERNVETWIAMWRSGQIFDMPAKHTALQCSGTAAI